MMAHALCALLFFALPIFGNPLGTQHVLSLQSASIIGSSKHGNKPPTPPRKLQGRFLHITDFHPDPFYKSGTDAEATCHSGKGKAGILGSAASDCDSPIALVNATFQWINDNIKDKIDFIIWTGDSARHDNNEDFPRTEEQVISLNELLVDKFVQVFGKDDNIDDRDPTNDLLIPIVPTIGNNDILPHNIFQKGPNKWTKTYTHIWKKFIPEAQRHSFERGGWYYTEVIPNKLAVFSLNTLYFFDSNSAVDGCDLKSEPGYEHFEWLRIQLQFLRERGMKAIMTGHVPPARTESKQNWEETCWQKYALWMRQYRDVVIGGLWGHMNIDHFMLQDSKEIKALQDEEYNDLDGKVKKESFTIQGSTSYLQELRDNWQDLPGPPSGLRISDLQLHDEGDDGSPDAKKKKSKKKKGKKSKKEKREEYLKKIGGEWAERFSLSLVSPSIVPNYYPTLRIIDYNITGLDASSPRTSQESQAHVELREQESVLKIDALFEEEAAKLPDFEHGITASTKESGSKENKSKGGDGSKMAKHKKPKKPKPPKHPKRPVPDPPSSTSPPGPGYSPQTLSWLSYTQYYANITRIDAAISAATKDMVVGALSKKKQEELIKEHFAFQVEYCTRNYSNVSRHHDVLPDLTVRSYLDLAKRIGKKKKKKKNGSKRKQIVEDELGGWEPGLQLPSSADLEEKDVNADGEAAEDHRVQEDAVDADSASEIDLDRMSSIHRKKNTHHISGVSTSSSPLNEDDDTGDTGDDRDDENDFHKQEKTKNKTKKKKTTTTTTKKKKKTKKKQKDKDKDKMNKLWFHFLSRAYVGTKSEKDLKDTFG